MAVDVKCGSESETSTNIDIGTEDTTPDHDVDLKTAHRKLDLRLVAWYSFVYLIMRIHVSNITNTAILNLEQNHGIKHQLGDLTSSQWAWCLSIFYYPYLFFEPASTLALKKFSPSRWQARIMVTWGIVSMCQGTTHNYAGLLACRFFLGLAEAGFYPGVLYHLSFWYNPERLSLRIAIFYASGMFSGTISGLLAYAIGFMDGVGGLAGWRWVFILEGIPAIFCGIVTYFFLPDYPETSPIITHQEKTAILSDLPPAAPSMGAKTLNLSQLRTLFMSDTFWPISMIWFFHGIGAYGITFVLPNVIYDLGFTGTAGAQLMTMPPYTATVVILVALGYGVHRGKLNAWVVGICLELTQVLCYLLLIFTHNAIAHYVYLIIATSTAQSLYPILWPERIRLAHGTTSAGIAIGTTNAINQLSGIVGPQLYQTSFAPSYKVSYATSVGLLACSAGSVGVAWWMVWRGERNRKGQEEVGEQVIE